MKGEGILAKSAWVGSLAMPYAYEQLVV